MRSEPVTPAAPAPGRAERPPAGLGAVTVALAVACGLAVANLYYAQPLLPQIARAFGVSEGTGTIVVTAAQIGYAAGLVLLLPLGDLLENRALTSRLLVVTAGVLVVAAVAPWFGLFLGALVLVGVGSVVAQVLVPLAAHLAPAGSRGSFVGKVMSGLLLGILLARTAASLVASVAGWRSIYGISAGLMVVTAAALVRVLPRRVPEHQAGYRTLLRSVFALAAAEPVLRRRAAGQALMFSAFTVFWTAIAYELVNVHHFHQSQIGLFALVGAAGAAVAPIAGRVGDRGWGPPGRTVATALGVVAMLLAGAGGGSVVLLGAAAVLLDLAVQSHQVLSQREIYALREDARARINSVFMGTVFVGGAIASVVTGVLYATTGWSGVTGFGAGLCALSLVLSATGLRRGRAGSTGDRAAAGARHPSYL